MKNSFLKLSTLGFSSILLLNSIATPTLLATKINISNKVNRLRSSENLTPITNISNIFKNINLDDWNKSTIDFTDYKANINIKNNEDPYTKIKNILDEANSKDYISAPNHIKVKNNSEVMLGYRYPTFEYVNNDSQSVVIEERIFGIDDYKANENYYKYQKNDDEINGYFFSPDLFGFNIAHPKTFFQLVTQNKNEIKWIWEDEKFSSKLKELIIKNIDNLKINSNSTDTYLWFVQKGTSIERRDKKNIINNVDVIQNDKITIHEGEYEGNRELVKLSKDASIELIDITKSKDSYSTKFVKEDITNEVESGLNINYQYAKTPSDVDPDGNGEQVAPDLKEENYKFEDGFAFYIVLPGSTKNHPIYNDRNISETILNTSIGDLSFNELIKKIQNTKNNLFNSFDKINTSYNPYGKEIKLFKELSSNKISTITSYKMNLQANNNLDNIWYDDKNYALKTQQLKVLISNEELNIKNFIIPKQNNNQISFEFNNIFKEMILNIYNLSHLVSNLDKDKEKTKLRKINNLQISYQEAFNNEWDNQNQIYSIKWYENAANEFNLYLKETLAYNSNSEDYEWTYLLKWIKDFFSEDIYVNYANENIKIWDSKSFDFLSFNLKSNVNTINKMYKNSNSNTNLISKLKIEDSSKFNIKNGNLIILNNNNDSNLKDINKAIVTFENNKNSFEYTSNPIKPSIILKDVDGNLIEEQNYTLEYLNNINVGQATILINGKNIYSGQTEIKFNITKANNKISLFGIGNNNNIIVKSIFGTPYLKYYLDIECKNEVTDLTNNKPTKPGTYYVKAFVDETNNYNSISSEVIEYIISSESNFPPNEGEGDSSNPDDENNFEIEILVDNQVEYNGNNIEPNVEIKLKNYKLEKGKDFELTFSNNINVGQATITIIGLGNFKGMKLTQIFSITKAKNIIDVKYDKDQNISEIKSNFGQVKFLYFSDQECKNQLDNKPTKPGTYYVKAFVDETDNYEQVEKVIEFNIKETNKNNIPIIIGSIFGSLVGIGLVVILIIFILKKAKR